MIQIDPKAGNAYLALGEVYHREKNYDQAATILEDGLMIDPRSAQGALYGGARLLGKSFWRER